MTTNPTLEDLSEARDIIRGLYSAAHSLTCNDPECPWTQIFNEHSESTDEGASRREDALLLVLLAIVENIGECIDLIRMLVASRAETSRLDHLTQSSTTSSSGSEDITVDSQDSLNEPPIPGLYHDQWTQTPAFSPPAYSAFFHSRAGGFPRAPAPTPATSETTTLSAGTPVTEHQEGVSRGGQGSRNEPEPRPSRYFSW